jgi:Lon protease-like protein
MCICVDPLFPQGNLSLHLFEPRYKLMMQRIVNTSRTFAYVPNLDTYDTQVGDVALRANLKEVEFLPGTTAAVNEYLSVK